MPAPDGKMMGLLARTFFAAKTIALPEDWSDPGPQYPDAFADDEKQVAPHPPNNLFRAPSLNKYHQDAAKDVGGKIGDYIDGISNAVCSGIKTWLTLAKFSNLKINGPAGLITPGCLAGPALEPFIMMAAPLTTPQEAKYSQAIAGAFDSNWTKWADGVSGVILYPAFAAWPGPLAPPTPNVPMPLIALPSAGLTSLSAGPLKSKMSSEFGDEQAKHADDVFDAIAQAFFVVFMTFLATTQVMNVLGKGPVPSFAPPFVPVGPVVMGDNLPIPGHLAG
jgi:hypothetical protein